MKTFFSKAAFLLLSTFVAFFLGLLYGGWQVPKNSGLAGPGIVIGYGFIGLVIGLILAVFLVIKLSAYQRNRASIVLAVISLAALSWGFYRYQSRKQKRAESQKELQPKPVSPDADTTYQTTTPSLPDN